ncbi:hypothetical protein IFM60648_02498 [Aspergillus lentulus]|uniref:Uncharacterized protein n=1 Tax=Aspergillus lentulus TaxID=293939 RepID=A0ABQ0ZXK1_ASPLE|nr:hypothetical protein IFM60648_02498 [Aspergillus lentulus]
MPIYDITHYLPIETLPHPETDKTNYTKPILVLIVSLRVNTWNTYLFLIRKLQREAQPHLRHKRSLQRQVDHRWAIAAAGSDGTTATYSGDVSGEELPPVVSYEGCVSAGGAKAGEGVDEIQSEGEVAGDEGGYLGDSEDMDEDDGDDEDEEGDEEDEQLRGDCPVAIHEVEPANDTETEELGGSYVAFVGHLEDSRSMAALILGICGVEMDDTE